MQPPAAFPVNEALLERARGVLYSRPRRYWLLGGAGSGKSTVSSLLAARYGLALCGMDERIYGSFGERYRADRHPASHAWMRAEDSLAWLLAKPWAEFNAWSQAADAGYLDLLAEELEAEAAAPTLVDGGLSHPSLLARVMPVKRVVCLAQRDSDSARVWEESAERRAMKEMIHHLPNPEEAWRRFLEDDARLTREMAAEAEQAGVAVVWRDTTTTPETTAAEVAWTLSFSASA